MRTLIVLTAAALVSGCAMMGAGEGVRATASLQPTKGNSTRGTVTFVQQGERVLVTTDISGLKPNAEHGFHVHEKGDCKSDDGMSAGGHFDPAGKEHGFYLATEKHAGDMPNLKADANGNAKGTFEATLITIGKGPADIVGKGLIVHRDRDDYNSQPAGNAGPRLACAVIARS